MVDEIRAGDVVVCLDASPCRCCGCPANVVEKQLYRVEATTFSSNKVFGKFRSVVLAGVPKPFSRHKPNTIAIDRLRKLPPADEQFIQQIRACRPVKTLARPDQEPAHG